jgi:hypothetical protein
MGCLFFLLKDEPELHQGEPLELQEERQSSKVSLFASG